MRRLLRAMARGEEITQDMSTLENPAILEQLRGVDSGPAAKKKTAKTASTRSVKKAANRPAARAKRAAKPATRKAAARKAATRKAAARKGKVASKRAKPSGPKARSARRKK